MVYVPVPAHAYAVVRLEAVEGLCRVTRSCIPGYMSTHIAGDWFDNAWPHGQRIPNLVYRKCVNR